MNLLELIDMLDQCPSKQKEIVIKFIGVSLAEVGFVFLKDDKNHIVIAQDIEGDLYSSVVSLGGDMKISCVAGPGSQENSEEQSLTYADFDKVFTGLLN